MKTSVRPLARVPETWKKYRPSKCKGCWSGCCTLPVRVNTEDLYHMGYIRADQVNGPLKRIAARLQREGVIRSFSERSRSFLLVQHKNGDCVFLDEKRMCTIYDRRPHVCRDFPWNSARPGYCPEAPA